MKLMILLAFVWAPLTFAQVGQVIKHLGSTNGHVMRKNHKIPLSVGLDLEQNDQIFTEDSYTVIYIEPSTQVSLNQGTSITITQNYLNEQDTDRSFSLIDLIKGIIKVHVTNKVGVEIDQKVKAGVVTLGVRGTEFEVALEGDDVDLDVEEGQVEVASPLIQSFVPEMVNGREGLSFSRKEKKFLKRTLRNTRFKKDPGFLNREIIRQKWIERRVLRIKKREEAKVKANLEAIPEEGHQPNRKARRDLRNEKEIIRKEREVKTDRRKR